MDGETARVLVRVGEAALQNLRGRLMPKMAARSFADLAHIAEDAA